MNLNKVYLIGRLTADPEMRTTTSGTPVLSVSLATSRKYKDNTGRDREETEFHRISMFGRTAEIVNQYSQKGAILMVEGRIKTNEWTDKQGIKRKDREIVAEAIQLGPRPTNSAPKERQFVEKPLEPGEDQFADIPEINVDDDLNTDDIPF